MSTAATPKPTAARAKKGTAGAEQAARIDTQLAHLHGRGVITRWERAVPTEIGQPARWNLGNGGAFAVDRADASWVEPFITGCHVALNAGPKPRMP